MGKKDEGKRRKQQNVGINSHSVLYEYMKRENREEHINKGKLSSPEDSFDPTQLLDSLPSLSETHNSSVPSLRWPVIHGR